MRRRACAEATAGCRLRGPAPAPRLGRPRSARLSANVRVPSGSWRSLEALCAASAAAGRRTPGRGRRERDPGTSSLSGVAPPIRHRPYRRAWRGGIRMGLCPKMPTADCCGCEHGLAAQQISVSRERYGRSAAWAMTGFMSPHANAGIFLSEFLMHGRGVTGTVGVGRAEGGGCADPSRPPGDARPRGPFSVRPAVPGRRDPESVLA